MRREEEIQRLWQAFPWHKRQLLRQRQTWLERLSQVDSHRRLPAAHPESTSSRHPGRVNSGDPLFRPISVDDGFVVDPVLSDWVFLGFLHRDVQDALMFAHDSLFPSVPERDFQDL